jgi:hypothetical protein
MVERRIPILRKVQLAYYSSLELRDESEVHLGREKNMHVMENDACTPTIWLIFTCYDGWRSG